jgi:oligopeptide transport system substrate-binding protein
MSEFYIKSIFSGLVELDTGQDVIPDVAQSWEISEDGCRYIFHLRDDVFWSDGTQVTAADFEYAWKRTLDPANETQQAAARLLYDIKDAKAYHLGEISDQDQVGVKAVDALTLEVELEQPASYFIQILTSRYPVPRHAVEAYGDAWTDLDNIITNGPFQLTSYLPGESIILERNPTYHGRFSGNLQRVELNLSVHLRSPEEIEMYESDSVDSAFLGEATYHERHRYIEEYISEPSLFTHYVGFNTSRPPFDDPRVRQAFVMAVDRERLADEVLKGLEYPATGGFVSPGTPGHSPGIGLPYDPIQARQLLAQAGYPDGRDFPRLDLVYYRSLNVLEYLKAQWLDNLNVELTVGIRESVKVIFEEAVSRNIFYQGWTQDYPDPDNFLRVCVRSYLPHWRNEIYDRLLEEARRTSNQGVRIPLYQAADKILIEEAAIMPITYFRFHLLVKPWVKMPAGLIGLWLLKKDVIIEPHEE